MELSLERRPVAVNETVLDLNTEQAVETDFVLADYYPRISRILHCEVESSADQAVVSGERLLVDGTAFCRIYYQSEEGRPASVAVKLPYSKAVELRRVPQKPQIVISSRPGYFSCRAVNAGRLEIRGAVTLHCRVTAAGETSAVTGITGGGMQCRSRELCCGKLLRMATKSFLVRGEEPLSADVPVDASLLRAFTRIGDTSFKAVGGKLVAKADARVEMAFLTPDGSMVRDSFDLPVSEILDADGAGEEAICSVTFTSDWTDVRLRQAAEEERPTAVAEVSVTAWVWAMENSTEAFVTDCFSTSYETTQELRPFALLCGEQPIRSTLRVEREVALPAGGELLDFWAEPAELSLSPSDGALRVAGRLRVAGLTQADGGETEYFEELCDFGEELPVDGLPAQLLPACRVTWEESRPQDGRLPVRAAVALDLPYAIGQTVQLVTDAAIQEDKPLTPRGAGCLTLYFPVDGEEVWEIAKRYGTSPAAIQAENGLGDDGAVGTGMLLIPAVR